MSYPFTAASPNSKPRELAEPLTAAFVTCPWEQAKLLGDFKGKQAREECVGSAVDQGPGPPSLSPAVLCCERGGQGGLWPCTGLSGGKELGMEAHRAQPCQDLSTALPGLRVNLERCGVSPGVLGPSISVCSVGRKDKLFLWAGGSWHCRQGAAPFPSCGWLSQ